jgi:hypothetical protein
MALVQKTLIQSCNLVRGGTLCCVVLCVCVCVCVCVAEGRRARAHAPAGVRCALRARGACRRGPLACAATHLGHH